MCSICPSEKRDVWVRMKGGEEELDSDSDWNFNPMLLVCFSCAARLALQGQIEDSETFIAMLQELENKD